MAWRKPSNVREWCGIIVRHRKKAFFPAIIVMIGVLISGVTWPKDYYAEAKLRRQNDLISSPTGGPILHDQIVQMRAQIYEEFRGRQAVEEVVKVLGLPEAMHLAHDPDTGELTREGQIAFNDLVAKLRGQVYIGVQYQTDQADDYVISFTGPDRELAPKIVNQLVENYIRRTRTQLSDRLYAARSFFDEQESAVNVVLAGFEKEKMTFEQIHPDLDLENPLGVQKKIDDLRERKQIKEDELATLRGQQAGLKDFIDKQPEFITKAGLVANPEKEDLLATLRLKEAEIRRRLDGGMKQTHPIIKTLIKEAEGIKAAIAKLPDEKTGPGSLEVNIARVEAIKNLGLTEQAIRACEEQLHKTGTEIDQATVTDQNFFKLRSDYQRITRDVAEARDDVRWWRDQLRRVKIASDVDTKAKGTRLLPLQRANDPGRPSSPKLLSIFGAACIAGLGVAAAMVLLAELLDRSFHTAEQAVDELKLPVLGAVNEIVTPALALRRRVLGLAVVPACCGTLLVTLIICILVVNLNLDKPQKYDELLTNPKTYLKQLIRGGI